jgi:two-component system chemotaxis response regulator CheB
MTNKLTRILIVDDSQVSCEILQHIIESDPELNVVGICKNGTDALQWLESHSADVITMDVVMPHIDGFEVTKRIMESRPIPIVIISSVYKEKDTAHGFRAMEAGALAILEKPGSIEDFNFKQKSKTIIDTIKTVKDVKLIKRTQRTKSGSFSPLNNE